MRLNGSATCMAPRRLFLLNFTPEKRAATINAIRAAFSEVPTIAATQTTADRVDRLLRSARGEGAFVSGGVLPAGAGSLLAPALVTNAHPEMEITQADIFAPVLSVIAVPDLEALLAAGAACPYALTTVIFGE